MGCPQYGVIEQNITFTVQGKDTDGTPVDTDALPTYKVYEDETGTEIVSGTMAKLDDANTTGFYSEQLALTSANGFERLKTYTIRIEAAIDTVDVVQIFSFMALGEADISFASGDSLTTTARFKSFAGITTSDDDTLIGLLIARATQAIQKYCGRDFVETTYREFYDGTGSSVLSVKNFPIIKVNMLGVGRTQAFGITNTSSDAFHAWVTITDTEINLVVEGGANEDNSSLTLADYTTLTSLFTAIEALDKGWSISQNSELAVWSADELLPTGKGLHCLNNYAYPEIPEEPEADFTTDAEAGMIKLWGTFPVGFNNIIIRYVAGYSNIPADLEQICIDLVKHYYDQRKIKSGIKSEKLGDYSYTAFGANEKGPNAGLPSDIAKRLNRWRSIV